MSSGDNHQTVPPAASSARFNPLKIIIPVLLALLSVSLMSQWYARQVSFPRYCTNPEATLAALQVLLEEEAVIDNDQRRKYMVAAKMLFLHPRENNESKTSYLQRIRQLMRAECR